MKEQGIRLYWFALKVFFNKVFEVEDFLKREELDSYIPCETVLVERNGTKKKVRRPVITSLVFFRGTVQDAWSVQQELNGRVILYQRVLEYRREPVIISDREMNIFMLVTSAGESGLEYLGKDRIEFHAGDRVRVIDGPFKGAEGHIHRIRGNRRLIVSIDGVCAVATSYIPQCFLKKISSTEYR